MQAMLSFALLLTLASCARVTWHTGFDDQETGAALSAWTATMTGRDPPGADSGLRTQDPSATDSG
jgi:hypothetical protein